MHASPWQHWQRSLPWRPETYAETGVGEMKMTIYMACETNNNWKDSRKTKERL